MADVDEKEMERERGRDDPQQMATGQTGTLGRCSEDRSSVYGSHAYTPGCPKSHAVTFVSTIFFSLVHKAQ